MNFEQKKELLTYAARMIIPWYQSAHRVLPWREDPSAYHTWVSEIMLQQTRVDTVIPYYERFIRTLPDIPALANCPEEKLLKLWEGLGYYSRVRNMQKAAGEMTALYGGEIPDEYEQVIGLSGIGPYTAGAILSIAYHKPFPVVDGNVLRVITRLSGDESDIAKEKTKKDMNELLGKVLAEADLDPAVYNQALMELGALICIPNGEPKCTNCPWQKICNAHLSGKTAEIPVKSKKAPRKIEEMTVFIIRNEQGLAVEKRDEKGLLASLYALPNVPGHLSKEEALAYLEKTGVQVRDIHPLKDGKHIFTHVEWRMKAYEVWGSGRFTYASREELESSIAIPMAFRKWTL